MKTKKDWQNEIAARVAAAEAVGEQKLVEARKLHASELEKVDARAEALAGDLDGAVAAAQVAAALAVEGGRLLETTCNEIERLRGHVGAIGQIVGGQRNRVGALAATISALRYAEQTPQIARVLDAVDGFVDLIRADAEKLAQETSLASIEPNYDLDGLCALPSLDDDDDEDVEPVTVEIDLGDFGETDVERAFFDR